jgi:CheY-like chemotaxis protein
LAPIYILPPSRIVRNNLVEAIHFVANRSDNAPPPAAPVDRSQLPVLLVDDSRVGRGVQRASLKKLGFSLFTEAENGAEALAAISNAPSPFGLIVTDCNMPVMDGPALVRHLKRGPATASVPVLMITGEEDAQALADIRTLGLAGLFLRGFHMADVKATIDGLFPA